MTQDNADRACEPFDVRELLIDLHLTYDELASLLWVDRRTVFNWRARPETIPGPARVLLLFLRAREGEAVKMLRKIREDEELRNPRIVHVAVE